MAGVPRLTLNIKAPMLANYFVSGSSLTEDVVGRVFTEGVREPEQNMLFAQNIRKGKEPHTSVITLPGDNVIGWVEDFTAKVSSAWPAPLSWRTTNMCLSQHNPGRY